MIIILFLLYLWYLHFIKKKSISFETLQQQFLQHQHQHQPHQSQQEQLQQQLDSNSTNTSLLQNSISQYKHHNLEIFHEIEIGRGSNGTVVFRGLFEGRRHVAVKKMVARFHHFER